MGNELLTDDVILKETLMMLKNNLVIARGAHKEYSDEFAQKGAKKGATVNIRKPVRYEVTEGAKLNIQDTKDQSVPLTLDKHYHVGMKFSEVDRTLSIDRFRERYIEPAVVALANKIDFEFVKDMMLNIANSVGIPHATSLPNSLAPFTRAKALIHLLGGPKGVYNAVVDPLVEAEVVDGLKSLFQSSEKIAAQYETGYMGLAGGMQFSMSQNIPKHKVGPLGGTPKVKTTITDDGEVEIETDGWTSSEALRLNKGDVFTIANRYSVNPQTKESTGQLKQFVVAEDFESDSSGEGSIKITEPIILTGPYQNVDSYPTDEDVITVFGHASSYANIVCPQNLVFHKSAFAFASADFELPSEGVKAVRAVDKDAGLSLTMTSQFDIDNYETIHRVDFLGGWKAIYPELACRVVGRLS